jgi:hypothetical protein
MINEHFEEELKILEKTVDPTEEDNDLIIRDYIPAIREILKIAAKQGHSGMSIQYYAASIANTIKNALLLKPLSPLTGEDSEWVIHDCDGMYAQNNRNSAIFKDEKDSKPYFLDAIIFQGEDEYDTFSGSVGGISSRQYIKSFPFTAKTFYIDVYRELYDPKKHGEGDGVEVSVCGDGDYVYFIKDEKQLDEVWEYYDRF